MMDPSLRTAGTMNTTSSSTTSRSFFPRNLIKKENSRDEEQNDKAKGPLGLTTLRVPDYPVVVDLVFVHGLNGGSQSTWCKGDGSFFWPKEWLPKDDAFRDVRIHTFGYSSGISRESILNIQDFAASLLASIHDAPAIPRGDTTPLILLGHSMGGLVIKKAIILGHQTPAFQSLVERIRSIFFLATPHQGADIANTLSRILAIVPGSRPFVNDLFPQSPVVQSINQEFPRYCTDLQLFSFFESRPMNYGVGKGLIVEKTSAVMNYPNERRTYLNANHRDVAKYSSQEDPSYMTVRNALATVIESQRQTVSRLRGHIGHERRDTLSKFLGVLDTPDDAIMMQDTQRLDGSGEWLFQKESFKEWRDAISSKLLWLRGRPGAGKSFLAGNVVNHIRECNSDCCCFFFVSGDNTRSTINAFLRSMAFQMALLHPEILSCITDISNRKDVVIDKIDHNSVWRQIFLAGILKIKLNRHQYWVIDALDECKNGSEIMNFLTKIQELWPLCVLQTSRNSFEPAISNNTRIELLTEEIMEEDSNNDISLFLDTSIDLLPAATRKAREEMAEQILERSRGCFLWTNLVVQELRQVHTTAEKNMVLASNPSNMDKLYLNILVGMSGARFGKQLAKAILTWTACCFRPLSTSELHTAIQIDIHDTIDDIEKSVLAVCGNLVYVDSRKRVQLIHLTVREFLMRKDLDSEFVIDRTTGHRQLASVCLQYLMGDERKVSQRLKKASTPRDGQERSPFVTYACEFLFQHLNFVKSNDDAILGKLVKFLSSPNILNWIEHIAHYSDLQLIYQAGKTILNLLNRRQQHSPPIGFQKEMSIMERWGSDLMHLVTKFSRRLSLIPSSIQHLIPPFCPRNSIIRKQFVNPIRGISVQGLKNNDWDECLTTITYAKGTRPFCSTAGVGFFALGMSSGKVIIYDDTIFQETEILDHGEPVWFVKFGETGKYFASSGPKSVKVWDMSTWTQILRVPLKTLPLALTFIEADSVLVIAAKTNLLTFWDISTGAPREEPTDWTKDFVDEGPELHLRQPTMAAISPNQNLLAVIYRGEDILLWDMEQDHIHDIYEKETGSRANGSTKIGDGTTTVRSLAFSAALDTFLLAVTYADGDLYVYNTETGGVLCMLYHQNAFALASCPDGRTLAGGDTLGNILLYDFETLRFLYKISFDGNSIMAKALSFTSDGQRLIDVRSFQCRVWQPTVLLRQDVDDENSDTVSISTAPQEVDYQTVETISITAITCVKLLEAMVVFCGKEDGSVHVVDISGEPQNHQLFVQSHGVPITYLHFDGGVLSCSDVSSRVTSRKISRMSRVSWTVSDTLIDTRAGSAVIGLVASGKHSRLLLSTEEDDTLWLLEAHDQERSLGQIEGTKQPRWVSHSSNIDVVILCKKECFELRSWIDFSCVGIVPTNISYSPHSSVAIHTIPGNNQRFFITFAVDSLRARSSIHIWDFQDFHEHSKALPAGKLDLADSNLELIIGIYGERFVYLDSSYWLCSISISLELQIPVRHCFIPYDWISLVNQLIMDVGRGGEVIFVKQSELAIIRRGLETTESGIPFNPRRRSSGQASTLALPVRPGPGPLVGRSHRTA